ncbi:MAG: hypothetical protein [Caudoviricetes sp.]|nr:MAG: hypothetical protein [Caudoviricetes sp.]
MQNTKKELQQQLRLLEEQEAKKENADNEKHNLVVMNENYEIEELEVIPNYDFTIGEKALIVAQLSDFEVLIEPCKSIIAKQEKANVKEWIQLTIVLDEVFTTIFKIVYDVDVYLVASIPNLDLFEIFINENEEFINEKIKAMTSQFNSLAVAYENK